MVRCVLVIVVVSVCLFSGAQGLYEDQVGLYDWYQKYVGPVSYVSIDPSMRTNRGIIVASETGVIASLDPTYGDIEWRQVFVPGRNGHIDAVLRTDKGSLLTISKGGCLIRSWDIGTGILKWENNSGLKQIVQTTSPPLSSFWRPGAVQATLTGKMQSLVAIATGLNVTVFSAQTGEKKWDRHVDSEDSALLCALYGDEAAVYMFAAVEHSKIVISSFAASTGESLSSRDLSAKWMTTATTSCLVTKGYLVCLEHTKQDLYHTPLSSSKPFSLTMLSSLLGEPASSNIKPKLLPAASSDNVWVQMGDTHSLLDLRNNEVSVVTKMDHILPLVGDGYDVLISYDMDMLAVEVKGDNLRGEYEMKENRGMPVQGAVQVSEGGLTDLYVVLVMEDHTILMLSKDDIIWKREEALGMIATMQMLDLPAGQSELIETFVELTKSESNPLKVAILRAQLQFTLTKEFLMNLNKEVASLLHLDGPLLVRDEFNTRKLIIAVADNGKLFGLDSSNGDVVWQSFFLEYMPFKNGRPLLYLLRTTSHPPHPPLGILVGQTKGSVCGEGTVIYEFNPLTGEPLSSEVVCIPHKVIQTLILPTVDHTHSKIIALLTSNHKVVTYPSSSEVTSILSELTELPFFLVAKEGKTDLTGYKALLNERGQPPLEDGYSGPVFNTEQFWHVQFPATSEKIVSVDMKKANEHVSSQGTVMADRSVQYKYLNPNLAAVVTESSDPNKPIITVYLLDSVTGGIVYHTSHKYAVGPVHLVHSENWVVYQFLNSKQRRHEVVVLELYETHTNQSHTVWSSLAPPPMPDVLSQAYLFPTTINTITTTQTLRGITYKGIILGLHTGQLAVLPKAFLNPRRELFVTNQMQEDGVPPYHPEIVLNSMMFINYNRTITRLRDIYTTPSGLESTSLVLACGLDIYYTRVTPSNQFDLLADDFDYPLIGAVVVGMFVATIILSRLAARKTLKALWK